MFITEEIFIYFLFGINLLLLFWIIRLEIKTHRVGILKEQKNLRGKFSQIENKLMAFDQFEKETKDKINFIQDESQNNIQNVEIARFNPFKREGIGGDQSFAVSFANKKGDGVVLSSLYAREKVSVFAKPLENWQSKYELSEEEKGVVERAKGKN